MTGGSLDIQGLVSGYGKVRTVHGIDVSVFAGRVTALVGSNGAGKSTTMRAVVGLLPVQAGAIHFDGEPVHGLTSDQRVNLGLVMVPEGRLIFSRMTVEENLRIGAFAPRARDRVRENLSLVYDLLPRLAERRRQLGGTLSGGEQQMLALGRGLMSEPRLLLLDEPTLGLAPVMAQKIFETIESLAQSGLTIILAEQNLQMTLSLAAAGYVMENGRIALQGTGRELLENPDIRRAYLGV